MYNNSNNPFVFGTDCSACSGSGIIGQKCNTFITKWNIVLHTMPENGAVISSTSDTTINIIITPTYLDIFKSDTLLRRWYISSYIQYFFEGKKNKQYLFKNNVEYLKQKIEEIRMTDDINLEIHGIKLLREING